jgi:hypothetical protein
MPHNEFNVYTSESQPAVRGPNAALEAVFCGPSTFSRNRPFREKSTKSLKFSENVALGLIWVDRRWYIHIHTFIVKYVLLKKFASFKY